MRQRPEISPRSREISKTARTDKPLYMKDAEQYFYKKHYQIVKNQHTKTAREMKEVTGKPNILQAT